MRGAKKNQETMNSNKYVFIHNLTNTPSIPKYVAYNLLVKSNLIKIYKLCSKKYRHMQYQIYIYEHVFYDDSNDTDVVL
jgi:hypothetical protein